MIIVFNIYLQKNKNYIIAYTTLYNEYIIINNNLFIRKIYYKLLTTIELNYNNKKTYCRYNKKGQKINIF